MRGGREGSEKEGKGRKERVFNNLSPTQLFF